MENKIKLPLPEDVKWEAVGRGYAAALMEKQHRIDRLEQIILCLFENICKNIPMVILEEYCDDVYGKMCNGILDRVNELKRK